MVQHQPFPYPTGVAMDNATYGLVKAKLLAADSLRITSSRAIADLQAELNLHQTAYAELFKLDQYDKARAQTLLAQLTVLQAQLTQAQATLRGAGLARDQIVGQLPRSIRKTLSDATPDQIAQATVDYLKTQKKRKWKWLGWGASVGTLLGILAPILL